MKANLPIYILAGTMLLIAIVFGAYPMYVRNSCWREAITAANAASEESNPLERAFGVGSADYNKVRDDKYNECLAKYSLQR